MVLTAAFVLDFRLLSNSISILGFSKTTVNPEPNMEIHLYFQNAVVRMLLLVAC